MVKRYGQLYLEARQALLGNEDTQTAGLMARNLLCKASGKSQEEILAGRELYAPEAVCREMERNVQRLLRGEPLAYVLGEWEFYGLPLYVTEDTLIPRDDSLPLTKRFSWIRTPGFWICAAAQAASAWQLPAG